MENDAPVLWWFMKDYVLEEFRWNVKLIGDEQKQGCIYGKNLAAKHMMRPRMRQRKKKEWGIGCGCKWKTRCRHLTKAWGEALCCSRLLTDE